MHVWRSVFVGVEGGGGNLFRGKGRDVISYKHMYPIEIISHLESTF
jgi:hypothetical protein